MGSRPAWSAWITKAPIERDEKRFAVDKVLDLHLYSFDGAIEVRSWDKPEVLVQIEKRGQDKEAVAKIEILSEQKGDKVVRWKRGTPAAAGFVGFGVFHSPSARLIASVPRNTNLVLRTGDGRSSSSASPAAPRSTGDGSIRASETSGELLAETGDGSIQIEDVTGRVEARTGDGSIRLTGTPSVLRARSGDGSIVAAHQQRRDDDRGLDGRDERRLGVDRAAGWIRRRDRSGTRVGWPRTNELTLTARRAARARSRTLKGALGDGGKRLTLRTGDGTIRLKNY